MKYSKEDYLEYDYFFGDEADVSCRTRKFVKVRKDHPCHGGDCPGNESHFVKKGNFALYEKALIDRDFWGSYYFCTDCMDKELDDINGVYEDE